MFLDDELLLMGRNGKDYKSQSRLEKIQADMLNACMANLDLRINGDRKVTSNQLIANFKRVDNTWKKVVGILHSQKCTFFSMNDFERYIKGSGDFDPIAEIIWKDHG